MKNSNLVEVIKSFSPKEIKDFSDFVRSPFFNKNESVIKLFEHLRKYYPVFPVEKIDKKFTFKALFPGADYNDLFMRKIIFQLSRAADEFLLYTSVTGDKIGSGQVFLTELNKRRLNRTFRKYYAQLLHDIENTETSEIRFAYNMYMLEQLIIGSMDKIRYKIDLHDKKRSYNEHVIDKLKWLKKYFMINSLNTYRFLKYQGYIDQFEFSDDILDSLIDFLIETEAEKIKPKDKKGMHSCDDNLTLRLHTYEIMLMKDKENIKKPAGDKYYLLLKDMLIKEKNNYSHDSRFSLYNILHQHCTYKILRGHKDYLSERFRLDKTALEHGVYKSYSEKYFPPPAFAIIVRDAAELGEIKWAEEFIELNKQYLEPENYITVFNLSISHVLFARKEYREALNYMAKIKPIKRLEFKFGIKELTLMLYYESSMFPEALYLVDSFRHFISKMGKHFSQERIMSRHNFLKLYTRLLKSKEKESLRAPDEIIADIKNSKAPIFNRDWLLEKAKELRNK